MFRTLLFVFCSALAACGQTGPLYPQPAPEAVAGDSFTASDLQQR
ncbi:MAG: lipoprotein [Chromatocurvus sp.]